MALYQFRDKRGISASILVVSTPPWRIRLKARVDLGDQTAEFIPLK